MYNSADQPARTPQDTGSMAQDTPDPSEEPGDTGSMDTEEDSEPPGCDKQAGDGADDIDCTYDRFPVLIHQATQNNVNPSQPLFTYQARSTDTAPFDELQIISYQAAPYYGPTSPGTYTLDGSNYADCGLCVLVVTDCNEGYQCDRVFFVEQGILEIINLNVQGGRFRAVLKEAVFLEVTINPSTYETTPVPDGDSWCVDELVIDSSTYVYN
jgi:hypothetical protein